MSRPTSLIDAPFLLGFDQTRALIDRAQRAATDSYPPYNVEQIDDMVRITLAVAGFTPDELNVTVEGRQLTLTGKREETGRPEGQYLHRGIASRGFVRTFVLADGLEVKGSRLQHGLLHVDLFQPDQQKATRKIPISTE